jgi:hypothetical protein
MLGRTNNEHGAAAVEMALVLPILLLLVFGIIEFGFIFNRYISVTHSAREGVRLLALGVESGDAEARATDTTDDIDDGTISNPIGCTASEPEPDVVQMECHTEYHLNLYLFESEIPLTSTARMRRE